MPSTTTALKPALRTSPAKPVSAGMRPHLRGEGQPAQAVLNLRLYCGSADQNAASFARCGARRLSGRASCTAAATTAADRAELPGQALDHAGVPGPGGTWPANRASRLPLMLSRSLVKLRRTT